MRTAVYDVGVASDHAVVQAVGDRVREGHADLPLAGGGHGDLAGQEVHVQGSHRGLVGPGGGDLVIQWSAYNWGWFQFTPPGGGDIL